MTSIRRRLLLALLGTLGLGFALGGWATYRLASDEAARLFDYQLRQVALSMRDQTFLYAPELLPGDQSPDYVIRVWDRDGLSVYYSQPHEALPGLTQLGFSTTRTVEGEWRQFATQHDGLTIAVAQPMAVRERLATNAAWNTLRPFFVLLPVLGVLIWLIVGRGLRPLAGLAASMRQRTAESLEPFAVVGVPDEVLPLVHALNDLLARLGTALAAQRAFVADAAHELRTPLAALQLQAQLVERAGDAGQRGAALDELKSGLQRATHIVQQMLTLARQEPGAAELVRAPVDLAALVRETVVNHEVLASARDIDLGVASAMAERIEWLGDADALRILLANLVGNALRFTPAGGRVDVGCRSTATGVVLEVADSGPGIPAAERERVFARFYRHGDDTDSQGSGLGLAIVRAIAERHRARVVLGESEFGGLLASVEFPPADMHSS